MTGSVGQSDPEGVPPRPAEPPYTAPGTVAAGGGATAGHPPRWAWWVIGIVVPVLGTAATVFATAGKKEPSPPAAGAPAPPSASASAAPSAAPASGPSGSATPSVAPLIPSPGPSSASASPSASPDLSAPAGYGVRQGRWGIAPPICGEALLVDLDAGVSTTAVLESTGDSVPAEQTARTELEYRPHSQGCGMSGISPSSTELRSATGRQVGVLRAGQPQTFENCRAAAGTGFGAVRMGGRTAQERGLVRGAALCSVTDQGSVAMALVEELGSDAAPAVGGGLVVWSKG
ncbi:hypothetical protein [Streptomyces sp. NBC_01408]|uniref:hypothetical protein n=1 Tax=Streptomyces sp. NBC_01408 TaxID=2903855 RepID=UPI00225821EA|nr:hypothetical protein [Streptomyces sp. NBC_01408]MCX4696269.1 hypothetical protein [Streptomyces sp. NBC_01408]